MSWLARSIANSLKLDDEQDAADETSRLSDPSFAPISQPNLQDEPSNPSSQSSNPKGMKEDLSDLTKTISRQLWGVASFLAPPPETVSGDRISSPKSDQTVTHQPSDPEVSDDALAGIKSDFAEISGKFKIGFSRLSQNIPVSDITKFASNFLQLGSEEDENLIGSAVGVTEEVVMFVRDISMYPGTWLDFPVPDDETFDDFDMSDAQQEHALVVERLAPRLAALRMELCPGYMSENCFWKIYFVLLHPRLAKEDAVLLSTPEILEARAMLTHELPNRNTEKLKSYPNEIVSSSHEQNLPLPYGSQNKSIPLKSSGLEAPQVDEHADSASVEASAVEAVPIDVETESVPLRPSTTEGAQFDIQTELVPLKPSAVDLSPTDQTETVLLRPSVKSASSTINVETDKHAVQSTEIPIIDKPVVDEKPINESRKQQLQSGSSTKVMDNEYEDDGDDWLKEESSEMVGAGQFGHDEDVSFSDLEEDDDDEPTNYKKVTSSSDSSTKDSRDWVQI